MTTSEKSLHLLIETSTALATQAFLEWSSGNKALAQRMMDAADQVSALLPLAQAEVKAQQKRLTP